MANPLITTETLLADILYLETLYHQCQAGARLLTANARNHPSLPWSAEVSARLEILSLTGSKSSADSDACFHSLKRMLSKYIEELQQP